MGRNAILHRIDIRGTDQCALVLQRDGLQFSIAVGGLKSIVPGGAEFSALSTPTEMLNTRIIRAT